MIIPSHANGEKMLLREVNEGCLPKKSYFGDSLPTSYTSPPLMESPPIGTLSPNYEIFGKHPFYLGKTSLEKASQIWTHTKMRVGSTFKIYEKHIQTIVGAPDPPPPFLTNVHTFGAFSDVVPNLGVSLGYFVKSFFLFIQVFLELNRSLWTFLWSWLSYGAVHLCPRGWGVRRTMGSGSDWRRSARGSSPRSSMSARVSR